MTKNFNKTDSSKLIKACKTISGANSFSTILDNFKKNKITFPLVISYEESFRLRKLIDWLYESLNKNFGLSKEVFFANEINSKQSLETALTELSTDSLFSNARFIIVHNVDSLKNQYCEYFSKKINIISSNSLVLLCAKKTKKNIAILYHLNNYTLVEINQLKGNLLKKWIVKEFKENGVENISTSAIELLFSCYENNIEHLASEIAKLSLLIDNGKTLTKELVEDVTYETPEHNSFELIASISKKKFLESEALVKDLLSQGTAPLQLSFFLSKCFRIMLSQKYPNFQTSGELSHQWFRKKLQPLCGSFSDEELSSSIKLLKSLDENLKNSKIENDIELSNTVQSITARKF